MFSKLKLQLLGFGKYRNLCKQLVFRDIKLKYRRSFLGYLWSVLNPLFIMIIQVIVFTKIFKSDIENFPLYLLSGQVLFNFMSEATSGSLTSIVDSGALIKKIYIPKYIFILSKVTSTLITLIFSLAALVIVAIFTHAPISWRYIFIIIPLIEVYIFSLGVGLLLAQWNVFFRDIKHIYSVILTAWTYLTPIFYPIELLDGTVGYVITRFNPMYYFIVQFRCVVLYDDIPIFKVSALSMLISLVTLLVGLLFFKKNQDKFILYI